MEWLNFNHIPHLSLYDFFILIMNSCGKSQKQSRFVSIGRTINLYYGFEIELLIVQVKQKNMMIRQKSLSGKVSEIATIS